MQSILRLILTTLLLMVFSVEAAFIPLRHRANAGRAAAGTITCDGGAALSSHDCNVALLSLGPGGIAGAIQFLRPNVPSVSATSGGCTVTAETTDGSVINISKGRLEHGGVAGFNNLIAQCGGPGQVTIEGGAQGGGNTVVTISAA
ncbi:hypothetical protein DL96DRAFT_153188 [Flagelloscypha sp. PMI_526]|nr:hypothetical protein DL96DRAFT_153188 [Flagelloscypha sp. PMI_526]